MCGCFWKAFSLWTVSSVAMLSGDLLKIDIAGWSSLVVEIVQAIASNKMNFGLCARARMPHLASRVTKSHLIGSSWKWGFVTGNRKWLVRSIYSRLPLQPMGSFSSHVNTRSSWWDAVTFSRESESNFDHAPSRLIVNHVQPFSIAKIMASQTGTTLPGARRSRKSVGGHVRDNATVDIAGVSSPAKDRKKSRSKSMGPGGLDALKPITGNRRVVRLPQINL
jgi:hypothetical protein